MQVRRKFNQSEQFVREMCYYQIAFTPLKSFSANRTILSLSLLQSENTSGGLISRTPRPRNFVEPDRGFDDRELDRARIVVYLPKRLYPLLVNGVKVFESWPHLPTIRSFHHVSPSTHGFSHAQNLHSTRIRTNVVVRRRTRRKPLAYRDTCTILPRIWIYFRIAFIQNVHGIYYIYLYRLFFLLKENKIFFLLSIISNLFDIFLG